LFVTVELLLYILWIVISVTVYRNSRCSTNFRLLNVKSTSCMEPECSFSCSQEHAIAPYPEPDESCSNFENVILKDTF
jgi:hypothetical protein